MISTRRFRVRIAAMLLIVISIVLLLIFRITVYKTIGSMLKVEDVLKKGDIIIVLRGYRYPSRALYAAQLYKQGYGSRFYISRALVDYQSESLRPHDIFVPTDQERIQSILLQAGIPADRILMGTDSPGGGTIGEARRVIRMMMRSGFRHATIVTCWWHTRRTAKIYRTVSRDTDLTFSVVSDPADNNQAYQWWRYRYIAVHVLEEFVKLIIYHLSPHRDIQFRDDPPSLTGSESAMKA